MPSIEADDRLTPYREKMCAEGLPEQAIDTFLHHLEYYLRGSSGTLSHDQIEPVSGLADSEDMAVHRGAGERSLDRTVIIKLNGGLGTSMGLERAKSLLELREGCSFLDLIARQTLSLREVTGSGIPLLLMNSFRTDEDSRVALSKHPELAVAELPLAFLQHRVPKVLEEDGTPASWPANPELEWCPPGHGDLFTALATSRALARLIDAGYEYAFVSNADNLGAVIDAALLGHMVDQGIEFMMEVADRTAADRKGGHLCLLSDGRLALREAAQCPPEETDDFQDVTRYRYFNTNNIWLHLPSLSELMARAGGVVPLATIVNRKTLDPRDASTPRVVQLETAMGSAISLFDRAAAVRVPRRRFSPVKNTNDLLAVRSDAYRVTSDWRVVLNPERDAPPVISLDSNHYKIIDDFEARFPSGVPSLVRCDSLTVRGDVEFGGGVRVEGDVQIVATGSAQRIESGALLKGRVEL
jgi:UTP--glucose-1-phosphate uridylyltransferase